MFLFYKVALLTLSWYFFFQCLKHKICFETNLVIFITDS